MRQERFAIEVERLVLAVSPIDADASRDVDEERLRRTCRWAEGGESRPTLKRPSRRGRTKLVLAGRVCLREREGLIGSDILQQLEPAIRPNDQQRVDSRRGAQTDMQPRIDRRLKAPRRHLLEKLHGGPLPDDDLCPNPFGISSGAVQQDAQIVPAIAL